MRPCPASRPGSTSAVGGRRYMSRAWHRSRGFRRTPCPMRLCLRGAGSCSRPRGSSSGRGSTFVKRGAHSGAAGCAGRARGARPRFRTSGWRELTQKTAQLTSPPIDRSLQKALRSPHFDSWRGGGMAQMDVDRDVQELAELGCRRELTRAWSSFTNFAISFTIISVLAGCFTNFSFAWGGGGPAAIAWGWPILCGFVLLVAFSMSELTSAYPTAGGPYWWAAKLGGPGWSWFTGWFNMAGLVG